MLLYVFFSKQFLTIALFHYSGQWCPINPAYLKSLCIGVETSASLVIWENVMYTYMYTIVRKRTMVAVKQGEDT